MCESLPEAEPIPIVSIPTESTPTDSDTSGAAPGIAPPPASFEERAVPAAAVAPETAAPEGIQTPTIEEVYAYQYELIVRVARFTAGDWQQAEDVVQETMARAWEKINDGSLRADTVREWLHTVARRIVIDGRRRGVVRNLTDPFDMTTRRWTDSIESVPDSLVDSDFADDSIGAVSVHHAIRRLSRRQRQVVILRYFYDLPVAEVAAELGIVEGAVKNHSSLARAALRRILGSDPLAQD